LEGELEERLTSSAMVDQVARWIADRVAEDMVVDFDLLVELLRSSIKVEIIKMR